MNKKNFKKAGVGLLVSALFVGGAYAFLKNTETATKINQIKPGKLVVEFADGTDVITLTGNETIPMTADYALANLTPYSFKVKNTGSIDAKYNLKLVTEDGSTIDPSLVEVLLNPNQTYVDESGTHYANHNLSNPWVKLSDVNLVSKVILDAEDETDNILFARIVETAENTDVLGKQVSFHLELDAEQNNGMVLTTKLLSGYRLRVSADEFKSASKSDFTSFKVNGEEFIGNDEMTQPTFQMNPRHEIGTDTNADMTVQPTAWLNGTNTFSFVFKGKEYSGTFEFDRTAAYKTVTWMDENHSPLKEVKYSMDDVELEVIQDGDISAAVYKYTRVWNADGSYVISTSEENL